MATSLISGSCVALITPMDNGGEVDFECIRTLVRWHIEQGTRCIVPVGTTGESPTLTQDEHLKVIETVINECNGRIPVMAGSGSNSTMEALTYHKQAKSLGADAALHVCGYYNRPNDEGIFQHFQLLNDSCDLPIYVYNIPPRAVIDISVKTMKRLSELPNIVGVKDATCDIARPMREQALISKNFSWLSGEDVSAVAYNASGGNGCISVTANVAPGLCAEMQQACEDGQYIRAMEIQRHLLPLHDALFTEPNPAGIKYALSALGFCEPTTRLPIVELTVPTKLKVDRLVKELCTS